jgi:Asp-tRNA(Asn)/Glu-tRNA(Gln) amidotransferase A subunit family amidase
LAKSEWSFKTAVECSSALKAKQVSAMELAQDAIARIERHDAKITRSAFAISIAALKPPAPPTPRWRAARQGRCSAYP